MHLPPIYVDGQSVCLAHLAPIRRRIALVLTGHKSKTVDVDFRFTSHCYSRRLRDGEHAPCGLAVPDGSKEMPRPRVFDAERYALSKDLIGILDRMIVDNRTVTKSRHQNFFRVDNVVVERDGAAQFVSYFIFMQAKKVELPGRPKTLRVTVESAYAEANGTPNPVGRGSRSLGEMLGETWEARTNPVNKGRGGRS